MEDPIRIKLTKKSSKFIFQVCAVISIIIYFYFGICWSLISRVKFYMFNNVRYISFLQVECNLLYFNERQFWSFSKFSILIINNKANKISDNFFEDNVEIVTPDNIQFFWFLTIILVYSHKRLKHQSVFSTFYEKWYRIK